MRRRASPAVSASRGRSFAEAIKALNRTAFDALAPTPDLMVWEWLEEHIWLGEKEGALTGQYRTDLTPYVREPLAAFADKSVTDLTLCFGAQTGKTLTIMCGVSYRIVNDPSNVLWVMPSEDLAQSFSQNRWQPMIDACQKLREQKPDKRHRHLWKTLEQQFAKLTLNFVGSNSPANLASRPIGLLVLDETDKFALQSEREAGAMQNAEERTKSFPYPLRVKASTPTIKEGQIWKQFLLGDQRYYHVPCPHCAVPIVLQWPQVKWDQDAKDEKGEWDKDRVAASAFYECQACGGRIEDGHKTAMLRGGFWKAKNPSAPAARRSYHLSALYAPWAATRFGLLAVRWLETKGDPAARQAFINSTLAEPWNLELAFDEEPVTQTEYVHSELPNGRSPILTGDVQLHGYWVVVREWLPTGESWLVHAGYVESIEEIQNLQRQFNVPGHSVLLDMADRPNMVAKMIVENGWRGAWGQDRDGFLHTLQNGSRIYRDYSQTNLRDPHAGTAAQSAANPCARFVYWSNPAIKNRLEVLRYSEPGIWHVPPTIPQEYIKHLNSEKYMAVRTRSGRIRYQWMPIRRENHLRDCELMQIVGALVAGIITDDGERQAKAQTTLSLPA